MTRARVLQIGMDPGIIDFSPWPGQDAEALRARLLQAEEALRGADLDVTVCLLQDDPETAGQTVAGFFTDETFDVVEIGSGMRTSSEYTLVFEQVVNAVAAQAPNVSICFNDSPETTLDAVLRALSHRRAAS